MKSDISFSIMPTFLIGFTNKFCYINREKNFLICSEFIHYVFAFRIFCKLLFEIFLVSSFCYSYRFVLPTSC